MIQSKITKFTINLWKNPPIFGHFSLVYTQEIGILMFDICIFICEIRKRHHFSEIAQSFSENL